MISLRGEKILLGPSSFGAVSSEPLDLLVSTGAEIVDNPYKRKLSKEELIELLGQGITGIIAGLETLDKEVMSGSVLKVISRCGSGMSNVDVTVAKDQGIAVYWTPDAPVSSVAELCLGAMLSLLRMVPMMDNDLHNGKWTKKIGGLLEGKTVAIIGFGRIGRHLYNLMEPFKVRVLAVDPCIKEKFEDVRVVSLEDALQEADIVSVHASGEARILGENEFRIIKKGVFILNAARGSLIDEKALICALDDGRVSGAWLDVFEKEPYSGGLIKYPQVILTPHVGSYTRECRVRMETEAVENLIKGFKDK